MDGLQTTAAALTAARELLDHVPSLHARSAGLDPRTKSDTSIDGRIDFEHGDDTYALIIEVKSNGAPRFVRSAVYHLTAYLAQAPRSPHAGRARRLIPMIASPYLSPQSRTICTDHGVAYLDLLGNAHLSFGNVYIDRAVPDRPKSETRVLRSIFTPKAASILRVLLRDPERPWRVTDLARAADASIGHVSNIRRGLLEREWAEKQENGINLVQPRALLTTWRENYRHPTGHRITAYTPFHGQQLSERLSGHLNPRPQNPRAVYSFNSAAQWFAPFARTTIHSFYTDEPGAGMLRETLQLTHAAMGPNVILCIPNDDGLFQDAAQPAPGIFCAGPIVTYLDLWNANDRDREAANHLASKCFPWL